MIFYSDAIKRARSIVSYTMLGNAEDQRCDDDLHIHDLCPVTYSGHKDESELGHRKEAEGPDAVQKP